jgi:hypothetical protein
MLAMENQGEERGAQRNRISGKSKAVMPETRTFRPFLSSGKHLGCPPKLLH